MPSQNACLNLFPRQSRARIFLKRFFPSVQFFNFPLGQWLLRLLLSDAVPELLHELELLNPA